MSPIAQLKKQLTQARSLKMRYIRLFETAKLARCPKNMRELTRLEDLELELIELLGPHYTGPRY